MLFEKDTDMREMWYDAFCTLVCGLHRHVDKPVTVSLYSRAAKYWKMFAH